jgi:hypothetical protein
LQHGVAIREKPFGPLDDSTSLGGETLEPLVAQYDRRAELRLELLDGVGEARLGYVAMPGGPTEMLLLGKRDKVFELAQEHFASPGARAAMRNNYQFIRNYSFLLSEWRFTGSIRQLYRW